jgi:hypothetical protein
VALTPALVPCSSSAWLGGCPPEARVRFAGFLVTLFGVALVAHGIIGTLKTFGAPSVRSRAAAWWARRPRLFGRTIDVSGATTATASASGSLTLSGGGTVRVGPPSLEEQIAELKQEIARTNARVNVVDQRTQDDVRDLRTALAGERAAREASTRTLAEQVQSYTVGGIVWEVVGAWWVVVGQLFGAFPDEIAKVIPKLLSCGVADEPLRARAQSRAAGVGSGVYSRRVD